tara:strand:- start:736 stop:1143 length:408 start_codon:yes stop_codon:yes gene_type:complete
MSDLCKFLEIEETYSTRKCNYCKKELPLTMFSADASCKRTQCKDCARLASKDLKTAKELAGNPTTPVLGTPCDFCGNTDKKLIFEHDHDTLKFRGWLCQPCNRAIGVLERNLKTTNLNVIAEKLMEYTKNKERLL